MPFARTTPYNDLPLLPPQSEIESNTILKRAIAANKALAELKTACEIIADNGLILRSIILQESKLSSEIENIFTTNDELYRALSHHAPTADSPVKEVLHYQTALYSGIEHLAHGGQIDQDLFVKLVSIVKQRDLQIRSIPGTKIANARTGEVVYTPPVGESEIRRLLQNLSDYLSSDDETDPLIKMAIAHYQFEAIHPFPDGNGRTGRLLNILYLVQTGLLNEPVLYLSRYILMNKADYYAGLREVTERSNWDYWIHFMLDAIEQTAIDTKDRILAIRDALSNTVNHARANMKRGYSKELIELVFTKPYTRITDLEAAGIAKRDAASIYLRELERIGVLASHKSGREMIYVNRVLLAEIER